MKVTKLRTEDGKKLETYELETLVEAIDSALTKEGFQAWSTILGPTRMTIGGRSCQCKMNTEMHGHNGRVDRWTKSPKGYKRTNVPTWEQREDMNHLVNSIFDRYDYKANIKSGPYDVRTFDDGAETSWYQQDTGTAFHGPIEIYPEAEVREMLDSERLEAEYKENTRPERLKAGREYRARRKRIDDAKYLEVSMPYNWKTKNRPNKRMTQAQYQKHKTKTGRRDWSGWNAINPKPMQGKTLAMATLIVEPGKLELVVA